MQAEPAARSSKRERPLILVAEDSGIQVRLMQIGLERSNYAVIPAPDGVEALALIRRERPDLVTLDIDMPRMNGFQVLDTMRQDPALCDIPVIVLTVHAKDAELFQEWTTPNDAFMTKPYSLDELVATVNRTLACSS